MTFAPHRRVVVTGMGAITPLGNTLVESWGRVIAANGTNGETSLEEALHWQNLPQEQLDRELEVAKALPCQVAAPVKNDLLKNDSRTPRFVQMALEAGKEALQQAGLVEINESEWKLDASLNPDRIGACVGSGMSGVREIVEAARTVDTRGIRRLSPHFVPKVLSNSAAGRLSLAANFRGPNHSVSTACAAGTHAIGDALRCIQYNNADIMVAGGAEAAIDPLSMAGFCRLKALSTSHPPGQASRPFDKDRDGFVMGEGAALLVLEELKHARARRATILAEVCGYGLTGDSHHITAPDPEGGGAERAMRMALLQAAESTNSNEEDLTSMVGYVNAHATSTPKGDEIEARSVDRIFGGLNNNRASPLLFSSTKGATGHLLGAAGALEAAFTVLSLVNQVIPPTFNLDQVDEGSMAGVQHVMDKSKSVQMKYAMSNSFGFGGTNASLVMRRFEHSHY